MENEKLLSKFKGIVDSDFKCGYQCVIESYLELTLPYSFSMYMEDYKSFTKCFEKLQYTATVFYRLDYFGSREYDDAFVYVEDVFRHYAGKFRSFIETRHPSLFA